jgi:hypothetical protein
VWRPAWSGPRLSQHFASFRLSNDNGLSNENGRQKHVTTETIHASPSTVVDAYYASWAHGPGAFDEARLRDVLAPDLDFTGTLAGHRIGAEGFVRGVAGVAEVLRSFTLVQRVEQGNDIAVVYDCELTRPAGVCRFAEFFHVTGGRIQAINLVYDATEWRKLSS